MGDLPRRAAMEPFLKTLPTVNGGFNFWNLDAYLARMTTGPANSTPDEHQAMVQSAIPRALYAAQAGLAGTGSLQHASGAILAKGAGTGRTLPQSLLDHRHLEPGGVPYPTRSHGQFLAVARPDQTALILSRPQNFPTASVAEASEADQEALNIGCVQGCGSTAHFRFRSNTKKEPVHRCPFCDKVSGSRRKVSDHLEACTNKPEGWARTVNQKEQ